MKIEWHKNVAVIDLRSLKAGSEVLVGRRSVVCDECGQVGIRGAARKEEDRFTTYHLIEVESERFVGPGCRQWVECPECNGTGRVKP